jgi:sortase A
MTILRTLGKFLISVGIGVLLFVAWTLWGTGLLTARAQGDLENAFRELPPIQVETATDDSVVVPEDFKPAPGEPVFRMRIPKIDFRKMVVEGVGTEDLRKGPGHYPECRSGFSLPLCTEFDEIWPGETGRVVVSGHRTTYGAPFWDLNKLDVGDQIITDTQWGSFTYEVTSTEIVSPSSLGIVIPSENPEIVLTTCNPRFSAAERLVVFAEMVDSA